MDILGAALGNLGPDALKSLAPQIQSLFAQFVSKPEAKAKLQSLLDQYNLPIPADQILSWLGAQGMTEESGDQVKGTPALADLAGKLPELLAGGGAGALGDLAKNLGGAGGLGKSLGGLFG